MIERLQDGSIIFATVGSGLIAGLLFAFSTAVMPGLKEVPPIQGLTAMQRINDLIQNPLFLLIFMGTTVTAGVAVFKGFSNLGDDGAVWLIAGGLLYIIGVFGMTIGVHVPWNDAMAKIDPTSAEAAKAWADYQDKWVPWNHVRTAFGAAATLCLLIGQRAGI